MESFFNLLQNNILNRRRWDTREQPRIDIVTWIERSYHRRRRQLGLGRLTPIEYEAIMTTPTIRPRNPNCHPFVQQELRMHKLEDIALTCVAERCSQLRGRCVPKAQGSVA
jgi:putative transposase